MAMGPILALVLGIALRRTNIALDRQTWLLVVGVVSYFSWMCLAMAWGTSRTSGWWRVLERGSALTALLATLVSGVSSTLLLRWAGAASAIVLIIALAVDSWYQWGTTEFAMFGFGHWNYLLNPHAPPLLGWTILSLVAWRRGERQSGSEWVLLTAGWLALTALVVVTHRRGVPIALIAGMLTAAWAWWARRSPRWAWITGGALASLVLASLTWLFVSAMGTYRQERLLQYWASAAVAWHHFPFGVGPYGEADIVTDPSEPARRMTATGGYALHAHCEPLDALLCGGLPGLGLFLGLAVLVGVRIARIADAGERTAWAALMGAVAVHLMTDPTFGQDLGLWWLLVLIGCVFRAETTSSGGRIRTLVLGRWMVLLVPLAVFGSGTALVPALVPAQAQEGSIFSRRLAYAKLTIHPQWCMKLIEEQLRRGDLEPSQRRQALDLFERRMGEHPEVLGQRAIYLPPDEPELALDATLRLVKMLPFEHRGYLRLDELLRRHPEFTQRVPPQLIGRIRRLTGDPGLQPIQAARIPESLDDAIDRWSEAVWCLDQGRDNATGKVLLEMLGARFANVPAIAELAFLASLDEPQSYRWLLRHRGYVLERFGNIFPSATSYVVTPKHAQTVMDWLGEFVPEDVAAVRGGRRPPSLLEYAELTPYYRELMRLAGLERRASR